MLGSIGKQSEESVESFMFNLDQFAYTRCWMLIIVANTSTLFPGFCADLLLDLLLFYT